MAVLSSSARDSLPDSAFAFIEPGGKKDASGRTIPRSKRHFPIHDAAHVRNALARIAQGARFGDQAKAKVMAAAKRMGVEHEEASTGRSYESLYPEVRYLSDVPEIRSVGDSEPVHITGYAAAFNKLSRRLGGFVERVMPGAFDETLRAIEAGDRDVNMVCRFNHKDDYLLGTTQAGTLKLLADERGLHYDVIPPRHRNDVIELVQRGDVRYSSFAFRCLNPGEDDSWGVTDYGFPMRSLHRVQALDVAPVTDPAYRDTTAAARSMTGAVESLAMWVDAEPAEVRSMLEAGQAKRFFTRSDRPSKPKPAEEPVQEERVVVDDPAVALRNWTYKEADDEAEPEEPGVPGEETEDADERAMNAHEQQCGMYVDGSPCVKGQGHDGNHAGPCYHRPNGLPCAKPEGHMGPHAPMAVDDEQGQKGPGRPKKRDGEDASGGEEKRTLSGPEALAAVYALREKLAVLD